MLSSSDVLPDEDKVLAAVSSFLGESLQTPPMYSALKVNGKKLCDLARKGQTVEREARPITVYGIRAERLSERDYRLTVHCSKGTYIRTLCADIGRTLGVGGVMASLTRTEAAGFPISRAITLDALEATPENERDGLLIPLEEIFKNDERVTLSDFYARLAHAGAPLYQRKLGVRIPVGTRVALYDREGFFALAESVMTEDEPMLRSLRLFRL